MIRRCYSCKNKLQLTRENFYRNKSKSRGFAEMCKICFDKDRKQRKPRKPSLQTRWKTLLRKSRGVKINISFEEYVRLKTTVTECNVCKSEKELRIDHDHSTGKVRGVLCNSCNRALGLLRDSIPNIENLLKYIKNSAKLPSQDLAES